MSDFCNSCHADMHTTAGILRHPAAQTVSTSVLGNYNTYVKSGDLTGTSANAYSSLVPFEENLTLNSANLTTLKPMPDQQHQLGGMTASSQVMCVSCQEPRLRIPGDDPVEQRGEFMVYNGVIPNRRWVPGAVRPGPVHGDGDVLLPCRYQLRDLSACALQKCHAQD
jgi:hypothetical protein